METHAAITGVTNSSASTGTATTASPTTSEQPASGQDHAFGDSMFQAATMLDRTIAQMQKQLQDQSKLIHRLQRDLHERPTHEELSVTHDRIFERMNNLEDRVAKIENAITLMEEDEKDSQEVETKDESTHIVELKSARKGKIGDVVARHQQRLARIENDIKERATNTNFNDFKEDVENKMQDFIQGAKDDFTSTRAFQELVESHQNVESELSALQGVVSCKVDKSEMRRCRAILQGIEDHATFHQKVSDHMAVTKQKLNSLDDRLSGTEERLDNHDSDLNQQSQYLNRKVDLQRFSELVKSAESVQNQLEQKAPLQETKKFQDKASKTQKDLLDKTSTLEEQLSGLEEQYKQVSQTVTKRPTFEDLEKRIHESDFDQFRQRIEDSLRLCAHQNDCDRIERLLQQQGNVQNSHQKKIDVAMKFIDWYGSKGEAYEYNAASLERHMNALAVGNRSKVREAPPGTKSEKFLNELDSNRLANYAYPSTGSSSATGKQCHVTGSPGVRIGGLAHSSSAPVSIAEH